MTDADSPRSTPFDLDKLLTLVEMMEKHGLTEVSLTRGDEKLRVRRGPELGTPVFVPQQPPMTGPSVPAASGPETLAAKGTSDGTVTINSPTVGTFYSAPTPDDPPFINVGSKVQPETIVCIVEAMKVFNQIPAEVAGTVVEILAKNGDSLEFGQPLFRVRPD
jgi:acetyl-CoA carboxylase biotin carboxyl carrier protein